MQGLQGIYLLIFAFAFAIAVLWILMPFAVFGTKDKLQELIDATKENTDELKALHESINNK